MHNFKFTYTVSTTIVTAPNSWTNIAMVETDLETL